MVKLTIINLIVCHSSLDLIQEIQRAENVYVQHKQSGKSIYFKVSKKESLEMVKEWFSREDEMRYRLMQNSVWISAD